MTLYEFLKNIILLLIFASVTPFLIKVITTQYKLFLEPPTYIGIIPVKGYLHESSPYIKQLHTFFKDPFIKGIVLKIDCCECAAGTAHAIFNEIQQLKKIYPKPLITLIENLCVSGVYLIACTSDYIIASETAIIGGIGGYTASPDLEVLCKQCAIDYTRKKTITESVSQTTALYTELYQQFTKHVASARRLSLATVSNWAQEKIFTGKQAYNLGLVNAIGSLHTVITLLKEKALIDSEIECIEKDTTAYPFFQSPLLRIINSIVANKNPQEAQR